MNLIRNLTKKKFKFGIYCEMINPKDEKYDITEMLKKIKLPLTTYKVIILDSGVCNRLGFQQEKV